MSNAGEFDTGAVARVLLERGPCIAAGWCYSPRQTSCQGGGVLSPRPVFFFLVLEVLLLARMQTGPLSKVIEESASRANRG